ncbi:CYTH domain-containing protein [Luteolibacter arcticus]|uniref:CYTH domain-containing protein n=1 Tax=Luteolibacter arcticus TaxID=1581411 RepID=A0ABT3GKI1_9BACT|nr:CYTH domain-containing protein [Luteolibacter arcticus]MCW1924030.1 CYTH domain-containing protein [Luteolibacter arcticus]
MATETERKFLVTSDAWREGPPGMRICQGYLSLDPGRTVRVRIAGEKAFLTIKGATSGVSRQEFEYAIPLDDARALLDLCVPSPVDKIRHERQHGAHLWEVDEFLGANAGLVVAEIELEDADEEFDHPEWLGGEVSDDPRYYNASLARQPWSEWGA